MGFLLSMMRGFSIRLRMVSAIAVVLALLGLVGTAGVWGLQRLETLGEHFAEHAFAESVAMADLRVALSELQRLERDMIIQYERPAEITVIEGRWHQAGSQIDKQVQAILEGEEDEDNPIARELLSSVKAYIKEAESVVVQLKTGAFDTATVANLRLVKAHQHVAHAEMLTRKLTDIVNQEAAQLQAEQRATAQRALLGFGVAVAVAMLVVVPTTLANMQSICQPIEQAQALAQAIASGDLATRVDASGRDEVAALLGALKDMQVSLGGIVGQVHEVATSIRSASAHIAHGNKDLSSRTEHAASSLEETAASLQELTDVVGQTAEAAARASQQAEANAQAAQQGGHAVGQVVTTMEAIDESSQKIGHIIGVIDGIAFQTNILALNAAVEAARAGDAGRGFAVVASEVRSLAQRSAAAAQEIKSLIQASMDKVREGALQVQQAGVTMTNVVGSAQDVSELISGITRSAHDQSQGIMAINASVNELDRSTQQNATLVEQSSEAARALREQAERLNEVVSIFRVG